MKTNKNLVSYQNYAVKSAQEKKHIQLLKKHD